MLQGLLTKLLDSRTLFPACLAARPPPLVITIRFCPFYPASSFLAVLFSSRRFTAAVPSGGAGALLLLAAIGSACCVTASGQQHLRKGTTNDDSAPPADTHGRHQTSQHAFAVDALRQLAAVEVDAGKGQSSATGGSLFAMEKSRT